MEQHIHTLYHGTSARAGGLSIAGGIKPRGKQSGNWTHSVESRKDAVYMTTAYAPYFAQVAADQTSGKERCCVLEVSVALINPFCLTPDEDCLEQTSRGRDKLDPGLTMEQRTRWYRSRLQMWAGEAQWRASCGVLGNCAYLGTVPAGAIRRAALFPRGALVHVCDPTITIANYQILGNYYRWLTAWLFDPETPLDKLGPIGRDHAERVLKYVSREGFEIVETAT